LHGFVNGYIVFKIQWDESNTNKAGNRISHIVRRLAF